MTARTAFLLLVALIVVFVVLLTWPLWHRATSTSQVETYGSEVGLNVPGPDLPATTTSGPPTTTTTARARTAPTVAAASASRPTVTPVGDLHDAIRRGFAPFGPAVAEQAVRVAGCESTGDRTGSRLNPNAVGSQGEIGLFQLHPRYQSGRAAKFGWTMNDLFDPAKNIAVAVDLYSESGWRQWSCRTAA